MCPRSDHCRQGLGTNVKRQRHGMQTENKMATVQTLSLRDQFQFAVICGFEIPQL